MNNTKNNIKVALCCIACLENDYIKEWVDYYFNLGIDDIYIYDNNKSWLTNEHISDVLGDNYNNGHVHIIDKRDVVFLTFLESCYNENYKTYGEQYDWICYFDCDEFLTLYKSKNIKEFLSLKKFDPFHIIKINWLSYNDNGHIYKTEGTVQERFPEPSDITIDGIIWENSLLKSIIRGHLDLSKMYIGIHTPIPKLENGMNLTVDISRSNYKEEKAELEKNIKWDYRVCFANGEESFDLCYPNCYTQKGPKYEDAVIKHYRTKSCEEYLKVKSYRGFLDSLIKILNTGTYFYFNEYTKEKMEFFLNNNCENPTFLIECLRANTLGDFMFIYIAAKYATKDIFYKFNYYWHIDSNKIFELIKNTHMFSDINFFYQTAIIDITSTKLCTEFHYHINLDLLRKYEYFPIETPLGRNVAIYGFKNSIRYFNKNLDFALKTFKDKEIEKNIKDSYKNTDFENTGAIYIDEYTNISDIAKIVNIYLNHITYFIVCDDFSLASNKISLALKNSSVSINISWVTGAHPLYSQELVNMYLMSLCRVNFLNFHNSTIWWGSYLNTNMNADIFYKADQNDITSLLIPDNDTRYKNIDLI